MSNAKLASKVVLMLGGVLIAKTVIAGNGSGATVLVVKRERTLNACTFDKQQTSDSISPSQIATFFSSIAGFGQTKIYPISGKASSSFGVSDDNSPLRSHVPKDFLSQQDYFSAELQSNLAVDARIYRLSGEGRLQITKFRAKGNYQAKLDAANRARLTGKDKGIFSFPVVFENSGEEQAHSAQGSCTLQEHVTQLYGSSSPSLPPIASGKPYAAQFQAKLIAQNDQIISKFLQKLDPTSGEGPKTKKVVRCSNQKYSLNLSFYPNKNGLYANISGLAFSAKGTPLQISTGKSLTGTPAENPFQLSRPALGKPASRITLDVEEFIQSVINGNRSYGAVRTDYYSYIYNHIDYANRTNVESYKKGEKGAPVYREFLFAPSDCSIK